MANDFELFSIKDYLEAQRASAHQTIVLTTIALRALLHNDALGAEIQRLQREAASPTAGSISECEDCAKNKDRANGEPLRTTPGD